MINKSSIEEVFRIAQVEEVIEDFVSLRRRGVNMIGLCPFHDEKTPSFTVSPAKNIYKCFGCGKGGNPVNFVMEHESLSYPEAIRYLANKYNITLEETEVTEEYREEQQLIDSLYLINEYACDHFENNLHETDEGQSIGLSYFKKRGFINQTIKKFRLGYAINEYQYFKKLVEEKKYNVEHVTKLGLVSARGYDFYRGRVMFPIRNLSGKVIGFGGRILGDHKKAPKYVNSPESEVYNKRKVLYGLYEAKGAIKKEDTALLVEGYTDVVSLHQAGVENVVASSGTALTSDQVRLVKRYTPNITILYDGDPAGIKAALRGMDIILEQDMNVRIVLLPEGEDPDSFVKTKGKSAFLEYLNQESKDFILFKTSLLTDEAGNDPIKKTNLLKDILSSISKIGDTIKRATYIQHCSRLLEIDERILVKETNKLIRSDIKKKQLNVDSDRFRNRNIDESQFITEKKQAPKQQEPLLVDDEFQERALARIVVNFGFQEISEGLNVAQFIHQNIEDVINYFDNEDYKSIIVTGNELSIDNEEDYINYFTRHENQNIRDLSVDFLATPYQYANWSDKGVELQTQKAPEENFELESYQAVIRLKIRKIKRLIEEVQATIKATTEKEELTINFKILDRLIKDRNQMARDLNTTVLP